LKPDVDITPLSGQSAERSGADTEGGAALDVAAQGAKEAGVVDVRPKEGLDLGSESEPGRDVLRVCDGDGWHRCYSNLQWERLVT
jgi:hypothetical protein